MARPPRESDGTRLYVPLVIRCARRAAEPSDSDIVSHWQAMDGGGGGSGGIGGGLSPQRGPQSAQSVPYWQSDPSDPIPPSSHMPSECSPSPPTTCVPGTKQSLAHTHDQSGGSGGGGGDGGQPPTMRNCSSR